jgi:hypothetical protein
MLANEHTGVVWCPTSNHFTLRQTLEKFILNSAARIALGNDSAITAHGDLLDELRFAHRSVDAHRLYQMVTNEAAAVFQLPTGFGRICQDGPADFVVMKDSGRTPADTLLESYPKLVVVGGRIRLVSSDLAALCPASALENLQPLSVQDRGTYLISANVPSMLAQTTSILQEPVRLAGKAIAA